MAAPRWKFIVTDLFFNQIDELHDYYDMNVSRRLNGVDSGSFRVRGDNPLFSVLASQQCMIKGYRDGVLQCWMYVWTTETVGESDKITLAVTMASPAVRMDSIFASAGDVFPMSLDIATPQDRYRIFYHLFAPALAHGYKLSYGVIFGGITGPPVEPPSSLPGPQDPSDPWYTIWTYSGGARPTPGLMARYADLGSTMLYNDSDDRYNNVPFSDRLQTFSQGSAGFDWYWEPTEVQWWYTSRAARNADRSAGQTSARSSDLWTQADGYEDIPDVASDGESPHWTNSVALLRTASNIGTDRTEAVFEYGTGVHNLTGFKFSASRQYQSNRMTQRLAGQTAADSPYLTSWGGGPSSEYIGNIATWGTLDSVGQFDVSDAVYLQDLLDQAVTIRKDPMRRLDITPISSYGAPSDPPQFGSDFFLGDTVTTHIVNPANGTILVDGAVRVHGVAWSLKESGAETMSITISPDA